MSSVVVETNAQLSSQTTRTKSGAGGHSHGSNGFSGLVDGNLDAAAESDAATTVKPRKSNRAATPDQEPVRTGVQRKNRNAEPAQKSAPAEKPAKADDDAQPSETGTEATLAVEVTIKTGIVDADAAAELTEAVPETTPEETSPAKQTVEAANVVAVAIATGAAVTADAAKSTSAIESSEATAAANPKAKIAPPAGIAATALAKVAADTGDAEVKAEVSVKAEAEDVPAVQTPEVTTETAAEVTTVDTDTQPLVETAAAEAQAAAKAKTELATAAKATEKAKSVASTDHAKLETATKTEPKSVKDQPAGEQTAKPLADDDHRVEQKPAPQASANKPADADVRPAEPRPAESQQQVQLATHAQTDKPQPAGFGLTQVAALHVPNVALQSAAFTAVAATSGMPVPVNGLAVEIAANVQIGRSRFEIRLDPPELGRIDVRLDVDKQGQVTSHLIVEKSATLDLLRRDSQQLERALQDAGLKTSDSGLQFSLRDQQAGRQGDDGSQRNAHRLIVTEDETVAAETSGRSYGRIIGQRGGVDIRV